MTPRYPDFLCIGAQKAGTTWLHQALAAHPDLWLPPLKEVHYFDVLHLNYARDPATGLTGIDKGRMDKALRLIEAASQKKKASIEKLKTIHVLSLIGMRGLTDDWYGEIFASAPANAKCGEITPEYALLPDEGVAHIIKLAPRARFLFVLRDPIERGWSDLRMLRSRQAAKPFSDRHRIESRDFFARADYMTTIERFRRHAGIENLLVLFFDHIAANPRALLARVCEFLGVEFARADLAGIDEPVHQGAQSPLPPDLYDTLKARLKPAYERLLALREPVAEDWYRRHYGAGA
jgi:hypothetical protein